MTLEAIRWNQGKLEILDQLLLPLECKYISVSDTAKGWEVINKMQVRGAPAIAIVGCLSLAAELHALDLHSVSSIKEMHNLVIKKLSLLETARPTAINMKNASKQLSSYSAELIATEDIDLESYRQKIVGWCTQLLHDDVLINKNLSKYGCQAILSKVEPNEKLKVLTHCNTGSLATAGYGTALGVIRRLSELCRLEHVYCTETRPYNQGARLTAYELVYEKISATLICDSMIGFLMQVKGCHAVVVGADRVARNGDTANKIGTYQLAVISKYHNVPFYVCVPISSIDFTLSCGQDIPIEERPHDEMTSFAGKQIAAPGIGCWNPAFDVTPAELITGGIITEKGVFKPEELASRLSE